MMNRSTDRCPIWPQYSAEVTWDSDERKNVSRVDSPRAGGEYKITGEAKCLLKRLALAERQRACLTTRLINHRRQTGRPLLVGEKEIEEAQVAGALQVSDRARRLMDVIGRWSTSIGRNIILFLPGGPGEDPRMTESGQMALAWSESTTDDHLIYLCGYLAKRGWIEVKRHPTDGHFGVVVTVEGYAALEVPPRSESNKASAAM